MLLLCTNYCYCYNDVIYKKKQKTFNRPNKVVRAQQNIEPRSNRIYRDYFSPHYCVRQLNEYLLTEQTRLDTANNSTV